MRGQRSAPARERESLACNLGWSWRRLVDATVEDAIERLCFIAKVQKCIRELDAGQGVSHEDGKQRIVGG